MIAFVLAESCMTLFPPSPGTPLRLFLILALLLLDLALRFDFTVLASDGAVLLASSSSSSSSSISFGTSDGRETIPSLVSSLSMLYDKGADAPEVDAIIGSLSLLLLFIFGYT